LFQRGEHPRLFYTSENKGTMAIEAEHATGTKVEPSSKTPARLRGRVLILSREGSVHHQPNLSTHPFFPIEVGRRRRTRKEQWGTHAISSPE
jgi:hypothetical protein